jgi:hypothetical protein
MNWASFRNNQLKLKSAKKTNNLFEGIYEIYLKLMKDSRKIKNVEPVGLGNTRIFDWFCSKISPDTHAPWLGRVDKKDAR